jgi:hypothetical protein
MLRNQLGNIVHDYWQMRSSFFFHNIALIGTLWGGPIRVNKVGTDKNPFF